MPCTSRRQRIADRAVATCGQHQRAVLTGGDAGKRSVAATSGSSGAGAADAVDAECDQVANGEPISLIQENAARCEALCHQGRNAGFNRVGGRADAADSVKTHAGRSDIDALRIRHVGIGVADTGCSFETDAARAAAGVVEGVDLAQYDPGCIGHQSLIAAVREQQRGGFHRDRVVSFQIQRLTAGVGAQSRRGNGLVVDQNVIVGQDREAAASTGNIGANINIGRRAFGAFDGGQQQVANLAGSSRAAGAGDDAFDGDTAVERGDTQVGICASQVDGLARTGIASNAQSGLLDDVKATASSVARGQAGNQGLDRRNAGADARCGIERNKHAIEIEIGTVAGEAVGDCTALRGEIDRTVGLDMTEGNRGASDEGYRAGIADRVNRTDFFAIRHDDGRTRGAIKVAARRNHILIQVERATCTTRV